jgi:long-subunit fatty acid transport protein
MMKTFLGVAALVGAALFGGPVLAEGGYYSGALGARGAGRGGAVVASTDDVGAVEVNPAGLAKANGNIVQLGNIFSYNGYAYTRDTTKDWGDFDQQTGQPKEVSFKRVTNGKPWQALDPFLGVASKLGLRDFTFALAAYAPPGIAALDFPQSGGQRYAMVSREVMFLKYVGSVAWNYQDVFGVGVSAQWIHVPRLRYSLVIDGSVFAQSVHPVSSGYDIMTTMNGSSLFTFNAVLGAWFRPVSAVEFALSGQVVPTNIVAKANLTVDPIGSDIGRVTLLRGSTPANDVTVTLPLPMLFRGGVRYRNLSGTREVFDVELDVEYQTWSRVNRFTIETRGLQARSQGETIPLDTITIDKHWKDTIAVRLGGDYAVIPSQLTLRAGGYYETAVADPAYASVDFPGGPQVGGGLGASVFFGPLELAFAYHLRVQPGVYVSEKNARGYQQVPGSPCIEPYTDTSKCNANFLGQPSPAINAGSYSAASHILAIDFLYRN